MNEQRVLELVLESISELCGVEGAAIVPDAKLLAYGLDSVRALELIMVLEEHFDIEISEFDPVFSRIRTVQDLVEYVLARVEA